MDFAFDARTEQLRAELLDFMVSHVHSAEPVFAEQRLLGRRAAGPLRPNW
jgi:acyl-CoA dehydrogenase